MNCHGAPPTGTVCGPPAVATWVRRGDTSWKCGGHAPESGSSDTPSAVYPTPGRSGLWPVGAVVRGIVRHLCKYVSYVYPRFIHGRLTCMARTVHPMRRAIAPGLHTSSSTSSHPSPTSHSSSDTSYNPLAFICCRWIPHTITCARVWRCGTKTSSALVASRAAPHLGDERSLRRLT